MNKEFLFSVTKKDFVVQTFRSGGPGGQNQNKRDTGVRIVHKESGSVGESREQRSQGQNKRTALKRLTETVKFKLWLNKKAWELRKGKTIDQIVDEQLNKENLKIEALNEKEQWVLLEE